MCRLSQLITNHSVSQALQAAPWDQFALVTSQTAPHSPRKGDKEGREGGREGGGQWGPGHRPTANTALCCARAPAAKTGREVLELHNHGNKQPSFRKTGSFCLVSGGVESLPSPLSSGNQSLPHPGSSAAWPFFIPINHTPYLPSVNLGSSTFCSMG